MPSDSRASAPAGRHTSSSPTGTPQRASPPGSSRPHYARPSPAARAGGSSASTPAGGCASTTAPSARRILSWSAPCWTPSPQAEPSDGGGAAETSAFGGSRSTAIAHELFHADSRAVLDRSDIEPWPLGRRELSVLLCMAMFHAAGLEWYEMGDVWHLIGEERPLPHDLPLDRLPRMTDQIRTLLLADTQSAGVLFQDGGPAAFAAPWADAFRRAGIRLGSLARAGELEHGLPHVLSYHVIFHWNRLGLAPRPQALLAKAARNAVLGSPE
ncbi:thiopeptide-type bacteriocin biosynthesis protein [Streptomyces sp. NPDC048623]|uniref:thiopeptide-type bacteriocin biosynthesis protein n=1 Tax=Streptomyces sp. NPDC048623 TaxID=3155761 RepID=UPI00343C3385